MNKRYKIEIELQIHRTKYKRRGQPRFFIVIRKPLVRTEFRISLAMKNK